MLGREAGIALAVGAILVHFHQMSINRKRWNGIPDRKDLRRLRVTLIRPFRRALRPRMGRSRTLIVFHCGGIAENNPPLPWE